MSIGDVLRSRQFLTYLATYVALGWGGMGLLVAFGLPSDLGSVARAAGVVSTGAFAALYVAAARRSASAYLLACAGWAALYAALGVLGVAAAGGHGAAAFFGAVLLVAPLALGVPAAAAWFSARAVGPANLLLKAGGGVWIAGVILEALSRRFSFPKPVYALLELIVR